MTLKELFTKPRSEIINNIPYHFMGINIDSFLEKDSENKFLYDDNVEGKSYTFEERYQMAIDELTELSRSFHNIEEAKRFFKKNTEEGNVHYWGDMLFVYTVFTDKEKAIHFGVRVD